ncbi:hypothetical protein DZF91_02070 [Actinomadura logoneensis]|uniref:Uncharacterized protein n=1 Tax=Actinomadura logoneensis TaxID=2293572 RepID=A0A372JTX7_9ACTN|nr:hypothetical protein [Actinomadura logoneensis]RFU43256.1 hypothetical protein DZF91_02070 [Actinomadura logoneensis]
MADSGETTTANDTTSATEGGGETRVPEGFATVKKYVVLYGAVNAITLGTVAVMASTGHEASSFMWIRGVVLLVAAPVLYRMVVRAAQGSAKAFERVRTVSTVLPVAIVAVDLVPGLCPPWYAVLQGLSALALVGVAVLTRTRARTDRFVG